MTFQPYALLLLVLTGLFAFRVLAQLVQVLHPVSFLPPYEDWHSGALPYGWLVGAQGVILVVCVLVVWGINNNTITPSERKGKILLGVGMVYFLGMCVRLIVGVAIVPDHYWFGAILPTIFHVVLASFVMVYGHFHCKISRSAQSMAKSYKA